MKRILISIISAISLLAPLSAFEWGGLLDNNSKVISAGAADSKSTSFSQSNGIYLWGSSNLTESGNVYVKAEGNYRYTFTAPDKTFVQTADLDLLKVAGSFDSDNAKFNFSAGRFIFADLSSAVFAQNCDGVYVEYAAPKFELSLYAGYTGLLNSNVVTMLDSEGNAYSPENDIYALSAAYIPACVSVSLPALFANQTIKLQAEGFIDLTESKANRLYAAAELSGPLAATVFYNVLTDFGTVNFKNISNYSKVSVSAFPVSGLYVSGACEYASGNNGFLSAFHGFSSRTVCESFQTSAVLVPSLSASYAPLNNLLIGADLKSVFSCPEDKIDATGFSASLNCSYNIFSDVNLTLNVSGFKGYSDSSLDNLTAALKLAVAF